MVVPSVKRLWGGVTVVDSLILGVTGFIVLQIELSYLVDPVITWVEYFPLLPEERAAQLPTLCLLILLLFSLLPSIYPEWMGQPVKESALVRVVMAIFGFLMAQQFYLAPNKALAGIPGPIWEVTTPVGLFIYSGVGAILMVLSFHRIQTRSLLSPDGAALQVLIVQSVDDDPKAHWRSGITETQKAGSIWYLSSKYLTLLAVGLIHFIPVLFLGGLVGLLSRFYPLLELIAVARVVIRRSPVQKSRIRLFQIPDIEKEIYHRLDLLRTIPGLGAFIPVFTGMLITMLFYVTFPVSVDLVKWKELGWALSALLASPSASAVGYTLQAGINVLSHTAFAVTPLLMAVYGLWFWLQVIRRLPALLQTHLERRKAHAKPAPDKQVSTRPRGHLLPLVFLSLLYAHHSSQTTHYLGISLTGAAFLVPWLMSLALVIVTVSGSRGTSTYANLRSVQHEVFAPYLVISIALFLLHASNEFLVDVFLPAVSVYFLCNLLVYQPAPSEHDSISNDLWMAIAVVLFPVFAIMGGVSAPVAVGLSIVVLSLLVYSRRLRKATK